MLELLEYLYIIRKRIWIIVAVTVVAASISAVISIFFMKPVYESKATMIIGITPNNKNTEQAHVNDIVLYQKLVKTFAELAKSKLVAQETVSELKYNITPESLLLNMKVTPKADAQILEIVVQDGNPERAAILSNTIANVFMKKVSEMMKIDDIKMLDKAETPRSPVRPKVLLNILIALFAGLMLSMGIVFLIEYLDNTVRTENDIEKYIAVTVLASIPYIDEKEK